MPPCARRGEGWTWEPAELQEVFAAVDAFNTALQEKGAWVFAGGLNPPSMATTVDNTGEAPVLTDGPFAEAKEYLGGFWIIEAEDYEAAIEWTKQASRADAAKRAVYPCRTVGGIRYKGEHTPTRTQVKVAAACRTP